MSRIMATCQLRGQNNLNQLALLLRNRLSAVYRRVVLGLAGRGIKTPQVGARGSNVVPAAVGKIDDSFEVMIDRDNSSDQPFKPLQLRAIRLDLDKLVDPFLLQRFVVKIFRLHSLPR